MKKEKVIEKLRNDEHYYGDFGKQYLSNSDIKTLLTNTLEGFLYEVYKIDSGFGGRGCPWTLFGSKRHHFLR